MRILVVSTLYPLPENVARGTFVADHVQILESLGNEVKIINPLPRMSSYLEGAKPTLKGVSKAPKEFEFGGNYVYSPKYWALSGGSMAWITKYSISRKVSSVVKWLGDFRPEIVISHTLWPSGIIAHKLASKYGVPCLGVVHGWDVDVGLISEELGKTIKRMIESFDCIVSASTPLNSRLLKHASPKMNAVIPCHIEVGKDWRKAITNFRGRWRREPIDILFPSDPRRPEKDYYLALECGRELETRGWVVGITTLKQQPRDLVWDRMMVADLTIITSKRESGPMVAKESILCGTPVVSVDVGDVSEWLPNEFISASREAQELADKCEHALQFNWKNLDFQLPEAFSSETISSQWEDLLLRFSK